MTMACGLAVLLRIHPCARWRRHRRSRRPAAVTGVGFRHLQAGRARHRGFAGVNLGARPQFRRRLRSRFADHKAATPDRPSGTVRWQQQIRARSSLLPASTCIGHVTTVNAVTIATDTKRMEPAGALPAGRLFRPEEALFCITELQWYLRRCCGAITTLMAPNDVRPLAVFGRDRGVNRHGAARAKPTLLYRVSDAGRGRAGRVRLAGVRKPSRNVPAVGSARRWCAGYGYLADTGLARWWPCSALTEPMSGFERVPACNDNCSCGRALRLRLGLLVILRMVTSAVAADLRSTTSRRGAGCL